MDGGRDYGMNAYDVKPKNCLEEHGDNIPVAAPPKIWTQSSSSYSHSGSSSSYHSSSSGMRKNEPYFSATMVWADFFVLFDCMSEYFTKIISLLNYYNFQVWADDVVLACGTVGESVRPTRNMRAPEKTATAASSSSEGVTLNHLLERFSAREQLGEMNKWYCSSCKEHVRAHKQLTLWSTSEVLVIHLKRFSRAGAWTEKVCVLCWWCMCCVCVCVCVLCAFSPPSLTPYTFKNRMKCSFGFH